MKKVSSIFIAFLYLSIIPSSIFAMELQEDSLMKWGRRIGAPICTTLGGILLYCTIRDNLHNQTSLLNKENIVAASIIIAGLGSLTTKELRIARPVYHPDNGPEEDKEISELVMSYKNIKTYSSRKLSFRSIGMAHKIEKSHNNDTSENTISVSIPLLFAIAQQKNATKKVNELYYNQQKPILARLPLIGAPIDGILYDPKSWEQAPSLKGSFSAVQLGAIGLWICIGAYNGIKKSLIQEKTPEDIEFEAWVKKQNKIIENQKKLFKLWFGMRHRMQQSSTNDVHPIGYLPAEIIMHIASYLDTAHYTIYKKTNILYLSINKIQLIRHVLPYMGPIIKIENNQIKLRTSHDDQAVEAFLNEQRTINKTGSSTYCAS